MGPEMVAAFQAAAPALGLAAAGTAVNAMAERQAAKGRRNILNQSLEATSQTQGKSQDMTLGEAKKFDPNQRLRDMQSQEDANVAQAQRDLAAPATVIPGSGQGAAKIEDPQAAADRALAEGARISAIAREMAKVRAPNQLMSTEAQRRADLADQTGSMWSSDRNRAQGAGMDAQSVEAPWWGQLGKVAQGAGMMMAGNAAMGSLGGAANASRYATGASAGINFGRG